jgi:hypothetical protein
VAEASVFEMPDAKYGEVVWAAVVLKGTPIQVSFRHSAVRVWQNLDSQGDPNRERPVPERHGENRRARRCGTF